MHNYSKIDFTPSYHNITMNLKLECVTALKDGTKAWLMARVNPAFEDLCCFSPSGDVGPEITPSEWVGHVIEAATCFARAHDLKIRPIQIPVPMAAIFDPNLVAVVEAGVKRSNIYAREIRLEFPEPMVNANLVDSINIFSALFHRGFRMGINTTLGWHASIPQSLRSMIDCVRLDSYEALNDKSLCLKMGVIAAAGINMVAERPKKSDCNQLMALGVHHALIV